LADPLHEILQSPLDDLPENRISPIDTAVIAIALVIGIAIGWIVGTPQGDPTTTTTTPPQATDPLDLPPGWVDTGLGYAVGVSWMYTRGPDLIVGVSAANFAGSDPVPFGATDLGFSRRGVGRWTVELNGGQRFEHTREMFDLVATGTATIEFAGIGAAVEDVRSIGVTPASGTGLRTQRVTLPLDRLPARFDTIAPIAATERVVSSPDGTERTDLTFVTIDDLTLDWSNAAVSWTLDDDAEIGVMVETMITIAGDTDDPVILDAVVGGGAFLQRSFPPLSPSSSGLSVLRKTSGATADSYSPDQAELSLTISWLRFDGPRIDLPIDGVTRLDAVG
jgi:hypothetical protein